MKVPETIAAATMQMEESQNQRDARVEELWRKLDPKHKGELDLKGLQRGLKRIDHPMKNAGDLLKEIMKMVDTNGDGKIQYDEFRIFVETTEKQLLQLFRSIDTDQDGRVEKAELQNAFKKAGITVPTRKLTEFFNEIDLNNDGYISFDEWRDFLLFMPIHHGSSPLQGALSYYSRIVTLTSEGDSLVSEDTLEGLGTTGDLIQFLFGTLIMLAKPSIQRPLYPPPSTARPDTLEGGPGTYSEDSASLYDASAEDAAEAARIQMELDWEKEMQDGAFWLTQFMPAPGYFLAGAIAGGVSRTATAPLDRLKVYLLVNTKAALNPVEVVKKGQVLGALRHVGRPVADAVKDLWRAGGFRTFFAGNGLNVLKIMPESAVKFGSYEAVKKVLAALEGHNDPRNLSPYSKFAAGGTAGIISQFSVYPLDTLKFRMQCETRQGGLSGNALIRQTAYKMYEEGLVRTAYRGLTMGLVGMFPYSAIEIGTVELLRTTFKKYKSRYYGMHEEDATPGNVVTGLIGAAGGSIGATAVYPLNVLRTRLQTQGTFMHPPTYTGIVDVAQKTWRNEGVRGLYKGLTPNLLKVVPAMSITWIVYENTTKLFGLER